MKGLDESLLTEGVLNYLRGQKQNARNVTRKTNCGTPEKALIAAVMIRAIQDYTRMHVRRKTRSRMVAEADTGSAEWWIFEEESTGPYSFFWICEHLDLDPEKCRRRIHTLFELSRDTGPVHRSTAYRPDLTQFMLARSAQSVTIEVVAL
jgi:hypothetical protein